MVEENQGITGDPGLPQNGCNDNTAALLPKIAVR